MSSAPAYLPYGRQLIDDDDVDAVAKALRGDFLTTGPTVEAFEHALAEVIDAPYVVACANGTAALHLAALGLGLGEGDLVIVPTVTFLATANAARYVGAEVVFCDVDPTSGLVRVTDVLEAMERAGQRAGRLRAVFPVHLNGQCADPAGIAALAEQHELFVVEDASHALGTTYMAHGHSHSVGACAHGDITTFSFHPVKTIAMGEGGAVTVSDSALAERVRRMRNHGMVRDPAQFEMADQAFDGPDPNPWYYEMAEPGFNYRVTDISCALGISQLAKLSRFAARRKALAQRYDELLSELSPHIRPLPKVADCEAVLHLYVVQIDFSAFNTTRGRVMRALSKRGIGSQVHYVPVHMQPYYVRRYGELRLPGAEDYYSRALSLPLFAGMEDEDVDRVVDALNDALRGD